MSSPPEETDPPGASLGIGAATWSILVHGGAGDVAQERLATHIAACERAASMGAKILEEGGTALDAVARAVQVLEDEPYLNAGTGACLNEDGHIELDAAIMDGAGLRAGGVCACPPFANPIAIARAILEDGRHVLLAGEGAARFAIDRGFERSTNDALTTPMALERWEKARQRNAAENWAGGTVGAVARDKAGHVAAATSTGGIVNKRAGRVGDSALLGAGTYADDEAGACSTTGHGEAMMRVCLAKAAVDALRCATACEAAARNCIARMQRLTGSTGGLIVAARDGSLGLARTTRTMTWAAVSDGTARSGS